MTMVLKPATFFAPFFVAVAVSTAAAALSLQEGSFAVGAPAQCGGQSWCPSVARDAMQAEGLKVTNSGGTPFGEGSNVVMFVHCSPEGDHSRAVVAAASLDASAEQFRNNVRTKMLQAGCL